MSNRTPQLAPVKADDTQLALNTGGPQGASGSRGMAFDRDLLLAKVSGPKYAYGTGPSFGPPEGVTQDDIDYVAGCGVPAALLWGVIDREIAGHGLFERLKDAVGKFTNKPTVSLGLAQIQVSRAAELDAPERDFKKQPLTATEQDEYENRLEDPSQNIRYLVAELKSNYEFYGKRPGKSETDRWRFALAKHKGGHGVVQAAQVAVEAAHGNPNAWSEVSPKMDDAVRAFVEAIAGASDPPVAVTTALA